MEWNDQLPRKGLQRVQTWKNASIEALQVDFCDIWYNNGKLNLSNLFTKEDKDTQHFLRFCDCLMEQILDIIGKAFHINMVHENSILPLDYLLNTHSLHTLICFHF